MVVYIYIWSYICLDDGGGIQVVRDITPRELQVQLGAKLVERRGHVLQRFRTRLPGFRVQGSGFRVQGAGSGFRVQISGRRAEGFGLRAEG